MGSKNFTFQPTPLPQILHVDKQELIILTSAPGKLKVFTMVSITYSHFRGSNGCIWIVLHHRSRSEFPGRRLPSWHSLWRRDCCLLLRLHSFPQEHNEPSRGKWCFSNVYR